MSAVGTGSGGRWTLLVAGLIGLALGAAFGWQRSQPADAKGLDARMAEALRVIDPVEREAAVFAVLAEIDEDTLAPIRAGFDRERDRALRCEVGPFASAWADLDLQGVSAALPEWDALTRRAWGAREVALHLGRQGGIEEAKRLMRRIEGSSAREAALLGFYEGWVRSGDVSGATQYLMEMSDSSLRNRAIESFLRSFFLDDGPARAMAWVDGLPEDAPGRLKRAAFGLTARWVGSVDPEQAARWYDAQDGGTYTERGLVAIGQEWIERDPDAALHWTMARMSEEQRTGYGPRLLISRFLDVDLDGTVRWLDQQPSLEPFQVTLPLVVRALADERSPERAIEWIERMSEPEQRERMLANVVGTWLDSDPDAANAWLAQADLSEATRQRIAARRSAGTADEAEDEP